MRIMRDTDTRLVDVSIRPHGRAYKLEVIKEYDWGEGVGCIKRGLIETFSRDELEDLHRRLGVFLDSLDGEGK